MGVNIPFLEALKLMHGYTKFMKDLITGKKFFIYDDIGGLDHYSAVTSRSLVNKKSDPSAFKIPCTIRSSRFPNDLSDLGVNINLIRLAMF